MRSLYWKEAQEIQRQHSLVNAVFQGSGKNEVMLIGTEQRGWLLVLRQGWLYAATEERVNVLLEECCLTPLNWHLS